MQEVSTAYKEEIKKELRERAYMRVSFGVINQEAQANAEVTEGDTEYYSNANKLFETYEYPGDYATLENDISKIDGSMLFPPRENEMAYKNTGYVGDEIIAGPFPSMYGGYEELDRVVISLNSPAMDVKGLTIDFGNYPPRYFKITGGNNSVHKYENEDSVYSTDTVFHNVTEFVISILAGYWNGSRTRIKSVTFGYGISYDNDDIISSTLSSYVSPIGADVPQIDFSVKLNNHNQYFNIDNENSALNFLETGQEMEVMYGLYIPENEAVEWVKSTKLYCADWDADDYSATIRCQDIFRNLNEEYYKGLYRADGISYYDLAVEILTAAGIEDYYVDAYLNTIYTKNPLPRVGYKEALQIIANATRSVLTQDRDGNINIKSNFDPNKTVTSNGETSYSDVTAILDGVAGKHYYTELMTDFITDPYTFRFPSTDLSRGVNTGYISSEISDESGEFTTNPVITLTLEVAAKYYGLAMDFQTVPSGFIIRTYKNNTLVDTYTETNVVVSNGGVYELIHAFPEFDTMEIEFTGTTKAYNRIVLNTFTLGDITDFEIERSDMLSSPKAIKLERVKDIIVPCYQYQTSSTYESFVNETVVHSAGDTVTYFMESPSYGYVVTVGGVSTGVSISESGDYYVKITFSQDVTGQLDISGYKYQITEQYAIKSVNNRGKTIKWDNPLISDIESAQALADWLGDYYSAEVEYEYDNRGFPELDTNDVIFQENQFVDDMEVRITQLDFSYNGAFKSKIKTRRAGE